MRLLVYKLAGHSSIQLKIIMMLLAYNVACHSSMVICLYAETYTHETNIPFIDQQ